MSSDVVRSAHSRMDARSHLATEFFDVTHAELIPFVSDEATWYDFDYLDMNELARIIQAHYGLKLSETILTLPFWKLLDLLDASRNGSNK